MLNKLKIHIVKNYTLYCLLVNKALCMPTGKKQSIKTCADRLESTIGLLYYYFNNIRHNAYVIDIIEQWFISTFHIAQIIEDYINKKRLPCISPPEEEITLEFSPEEEEEIVELIFPPGYEEPEYFNEDFENEEVELFPQSG